eukprot:5924925-Prymnesium_polylepis.1
MPPPSVGTKPVAKAGRRKMGLCDAASSSSCCCSCQNRAATLPSGAVLSHVITGFGVVVSCRSCSSRIGESHIVAR